MADYKQGRFIPQNPKKYRGDPTQIFYRSGWEKKCMENFDMNTSIISWSSEEIVIPYRSPVDGKIHRYFVDFYVEAINSDNTIKHMLIEVKPFAQTQEPKIPKKRTKRFLTEVVTYGINQAKWNAAKQYCDLKGWEFKLITEQELFKKKSK